MGGGEKYLEEKERDGKWKGKNLREKEEERGYKMVRNEEELRKVEKENKEKNVIGIL